METHSLRTLPRGLLPGILTLTLLAVPLVAMQYTDEVQWDPPDFLIMGVLLLGTGLAVEWAIRRKGSLVLRAAWTFALLATLLMTWVNMAVGLLGGESSQVNMLLLGVPLAGIVGTALARAQPRGMALTLLTMAAVQLTLTAFAYSQDWRPLRQGPIDIWGPNAFFAMLFITAAVLFASGPGQMNRRPQGAMLALLGIGFAAGGIALGEADDAPGAALIGILLMIGLVALGARLALRRSGREP